MKKYTFLFILAFGSSLFAMDSDGLEEKMSYLKGQCREKHDYFYKGGAAVDVQVAEKNLKQAEADLNTISSMRLNCIDNMQGRTHLLLLARQTVDDAQSKLDHKKRVFAQVFKTND